MNEQLEPVQEMVVKIGASATAGAAAWSWVAAANDLLQLVVTGLAILTGIATYRYVTVKRRVMEKQLNEHKDVERKE